VLDRFHGSTGTASARSFYVQAVQSLTPRIFAAGRVAHTLTPPVIGARVRRQWNSAEITGGLRVTPHVTVRAGYYFQQPYVGDWSHAAEVSLVLDGRWWR